MSKELDLLDENIRAVMKTSAGRAVLWHILGICDIHSDGGYEPNYALYINGKKAVGGSILAMLEDADATIYPRLILEKLEIPNE